MLPFGGLFTLPAVPDLIEIPPNMTVFAVLYIVPHQRIGIIVELRFE